MQSIHTDGKNAGRYRMRPLTLLAAAALVACTAAPALTDEPDAGRQLYAQRLAIGVCRSCHGPHGNSEQPKFPRLAGQNDSYLVAQLKAFRAETRGDPDAISYMWGMSRELDDATIDALADYYSRQSPRASGGGDPTLIARGKNIYEHGIESQGVPICASCHGPEAEGTAAFPRLAGQHAQYVLKQLRSFQSNMRNVAVMHGVTLHLPEHEMKAVAAYLQSLR
jgi:cytochrome c553